MHTCAHGHKLKYEKFANIFYEQLCNSSSDFNTHIQTTCLYTNTFKHTFIHLNKHTSTSTHIHMHSKQTTDLVVDWQACDLGDAGLGQLEKAAIRRVVDVALVDPRRAAGALVGIRTLNTECRPLHVVSAKLDQPLALGACQKVVHIHQHRVVAQKGHIEAGRVRNHPLLGT